MKTAGLFFLVCILTAGMIYGQEFWDIKPYRNWEVTEVERLLSNSPWSVKVTYPAQRQVGETRNSGRKAEINNQYIVRLYSALPIRQGYVRLFQLEANYAELSVTDQKAFDQRYGPALKTFDQEIVVNLDFSSDDPNTRLEIDRQLKQLTVDQFKQSAFLITDTHGKVEIRQYLPPSPDGSGAKFIYPRTIDDKEVINDLDNEIKFELWVPGTGHKVLSVWKIKDLTFDGKIAY